MKRLFLLLFGMVTFVAHAQVPDYVPTEGLVAWYPFNGNANDESGNENHAVESVNVNLMPSFVYDSHWNREVIEFDDVDNELTVLAPSQLGVGNEFSFSTWLIPNEQNHGQVMSMDAGRFSFFLHGANDHFDAQSSTSWASEAYYCGWNNQPYVHPDGWFHMTITISSDSIKAFGNGQFIAGMDCGGQSTFDTDIIFGYRNMNSSGDYHWGGRLADCGMWNRALTESEVLALCNAAALVPGCTDPTACNFDAEATEDDGSCLLTFCNDTLYVPQDYPNVQQAVNASDDGDVIILAEGTHISGQTIEVQNKSITVQGCCSAEDVILSGENSHRVLNVSGDIEDHTVFKNLTIAFGRPVPDDHASALKVNGCQATFFQVIIEQNGGGTGNTVAFGSGSGLTLFDRCIVRNNSVENHAGLRTATVRKSILHNNVGWNNTCVLLDCESYNCTVYGNGGGAGNPWTTSGLSGGLARNCIFWNNSAQAAYNPESVEYSLNSGHAGEGNIDGDPMFLDANSGIFSLLPGSPAVDSGDPNPDYNDFDGSLNDMGAIALSENFYGPAGCTDPNACNFDAEATSDDGSCIPSGCMDSEACNYNALAECEGEACHYTCCPGPGCCLEGTVWDAELGGCIPMETNCPEDLDFDGAVGINDLMELLSAFGTYCPPEVTGWTCGDPVSYHGYDYATVKIGEQCWFAENLRAENYLNGDPIPDNLTNSEWVSTSQGARGIYVDSESGIVSHTYNGYAVQDERGVCPESWHVPSDLEWMELELYIGLDESEGEVLGLRGNHGALLKSSPSDVPSWDGTNELSFKGLPSWGRGGGNGTFGGGTKFKGWSSTVAPSGDIWLRNLLDSNSGVERDNDNPHNGCNVRCLKD